MQLGNRKESFCPLRSFISTFVEQHKIEFRKRARDKNISKSRGKILNLRDVTIFLINIKSKNALISKSIHTFLKHKSIHILFNQIGS